MKNIKRLSVHRLSVFVLLMFILSSCSSQECRFCDEKQQGAVIMNIQSTIDTTTHFNLYVPPGTGDIKLPVIIFFDAHGKTAPVIKQYQVLAEKYKVILAGFDPSANEIPFGDIWAAFKPWLNELYNIAPVDSAQVFLAGFSGGARVVSQIENLVTSVKATALCGAGPANPQTWMTKNTPVMFFSGSGDFNYIEIMQVRNQPDLKRPTSQAIFPGRHAWPPAEAFEDFFVFIQQLTNRPFPTSCEKNIMAKARQSLAFNRPDIALFNAFNGMFALGANNCPKLKTLADSIGKTITKEFDNEFNKILSNEMSLQSHIQDLFRQADTTKYKRFLDSLSVSVQSDSLSLQASSSMRLKAYCGIVAYSFCNQAYSSKSTQFYRLLRMYQMTEPENTDMLVFFSAYYAGIDECNTARIYLNKAKRNGNVNMARLKKMSEFDRCEDILN